MENGKYTLVKVKNNDQEIWIPLVDEYLIKIDNEQKIIFVKNFERLS
jgi:16S rRNA processing protein RimM